MSSNLSTEVFSIMLKTQGIVIDNKISTVLWEGLQAFHYRLSVVEPDLIPPSQASVETIVLHVAGEVGSINFTDFSRWYRNTAAPGVVGIFPRNQPFKGVWTQRSENLLFNPTLELLNQVALETHAGEPRAINLKGLWLIEDPLLAQIGRTVLDLLYNTDPSARLYAESLGVTLAHHLLYKYSGQQRLTGVQLTLSNPQLRCAVDYIYANFERDLSLAEIAKSAGLSVAHFSRLFRQATGYSPYQYLIRCRVQRAYNLLKHHPYTIAEIAQMVGFYDQSHLLRHFKRIYGVSPKRIRG